VGKSTGFIEFDREPPRQRPAKERVADSKEFYLQWKEQDASDQGARCMNCAVPFCSNGCPLGNLIPEWNHLIYVGQWEQALKRLHATNNFPEFTGRICPAPCEPACVLSINDDPVTIEYIERAIVEKGFNEGWIKPQTPSHRTGKRVAIIGSGPSGLAAAQQLNRAGHLVTVFEQDETIGGLLRLGIPDFKLEKHIVQRRVDLLSEEGIVFKTNVNVGHDIPAIELTTDFDAVCITVGSREARELPIPGREFTGIHLAMTYLAQQNRRLTGTSFSPENTITAKDKTVIILGGGDTGADCLGTAHRQGAREVYQIELLPEPPKERSGNNPWPQWPQIIRSSPAHDEGGLRDYSILTKSFSGENGNVSKLNGVRIEWGAPDKTGRPSMQEIAGSEFSIDTELVLLAMGFVHPEHDGLINDLGVDLDQRGNILTNRYRSTSVPGVFAAGDAARGQSLVVWAIAEGRQAAHGVDKYLMGKSSLPQVRL
jgi:glutamate synthase (NADPH/NADH) small chain